MFTRRGLFGLVAGLAALPFVGRAFRAEAAGPENIYFDKESFEQGIADLALYRYEHRAPGEMKWVTVSGKFREGDSVWLPPGDIRNFTVTQEFTADLGKMEVSYLQAGD